MVNNTTEFFKVSLSSNDFSLLSEEDVAEMGSSAETIINIMSKILKRQPNPDLTNFVGQLKTVADSYVTVANGLLQDNEG